MTAGYVAFGVGSVLPTVWLAIADCRAAARPAPVARSQAGLVVAWDLLVVGVLAGIVLALGAPRQVGLAFAAGIGVCAAGRWLSGRLAVRRPAFELTRPAAVARIRGGPRARAVERIGAERDRWLSRCAGEAAARLCDLPPAELERAAVDHVRTRSFAGALRGRQQPTDLPATLARIRHLLADDQEPYARRVEALVQLLLESDGEPAIRALHPATTPARAEPDAPVTPSQPVPPTVEPAAPAPRDDRPATPPSDGAPAPTSDPRPTAETANSAPVPALERRPTAAPTPRLDRRSTTPPADAAVPPPEPRPTAAVAGSASVPTLDRCSTAPPADTAPAPPLDRRPTVAPADSAGPPQRDRRRPVAAGDTAAPEDPRSAASAVPPAGPVIGPTGRIRGTGRTRARVPAEGQPESTDPESAVPLSGLGSPAAD